MKVLFLELGVYMAVFTLFCLSAELVITRRLYGLHATIQDSVIFLHSNSLIYFCEYYFHAYFLNTHTSVHHLLCLEPRGESPSTSRTSSAYQFYFPCCATAEHLA